MPKKYLSLFLSLCISASFFGMPSIVTAKTKAKKKSAQQTLVGTYRCWSMNVGGRGGRCTSPPLVFNTNGTYAMSQERGTYRIQNNTVLLSQSKIRGPGNLAGSEKIIFRYTYKGLSHTVTYLRSKTPNTVKHPSVSLSTPAEEAAAFIEVDMTLEYDREDGSLGWINTLVLVPQGSTPANALHRPETLAVQETKTKLHAFFKEVERGRMYDVYTSTGLESKKVGTLDLRAPDGALVKTTLSVILPKVQPQGENKKEETTQLKTPDTPTIQQETQTQNKNLPTCDPNIPAYSQAPCKRD